MKIKSLFKLLFSRLIIVGLLILIQVLILTLFILKLSHNFIYVYIALLCLSIIMVIYILNKDMNPSVKLPWIVLIMVAPILGGFYYLYFGTTRISKKHKTKMDTLEKSMSKLYPRNEKIYNQLLSENKLMASQAKYTQNSSYYPVYNNTDTEYYKLGEIMFEKMKKELQNATNFIFLEYFIIEEGIMWNSILEILKEKAANGVDVRVIYDDGGCIQTLPRNYDKKLRQMGIKAQVFNKLIPILDSTLNNRDHRKILVIDGNIGFTGGINLADEYINHINKCGHWKDCGVMLKGDAVWSLTLMFLKTWNFYNNIDNDFTKFKPKYINDDNLKNDGYVQPFGDTPLDNENLSESIYLNMINQCTEYLYINTPYLIPDNEILTALTLAAKRGVDVRIITPGISDNWFVQNVAQSHFKQLLLGGVKVYEYSKGFVHSKTFLSDDNLAVIGTVNLDYRSLYHNFECGIWMYKSKAVFQLKSDFEECLKESKEISLEETKKVSGSIRFIRGILRFIAPLM